MYCRSDCYYVVIIMLKLVERYDTMKQFKKDIFEMNQELRKSKPGRFYDMPIVNHHHGACRLPSFNS